MNRTNWKDLKNSSHPPFPYLSIVFVGKKGLSHPADSAIPRAPATGSTASSSSWRAIGSDDAPAVMGKSSMNVGFSILPCLITGGHVTHMLAVSL